MVCSGHSRPRACTLEKHQFGNGGSPVFNQFNTSFKSKFVVIFPIASIWWRNMTLHDQEMRVVWIYGCITLKEIFMLRPIRRQIRRSRRCTERNPLRGVPGIAIPWLLRLGVWRCWRRRRVRLPAGARPVSGSGSRTVQPSGPRGPSTSSCQAQQSGPLGPARR